jgi:O-antigen/teichoic acid export membrane protein
LIHQREKLRSILQLKTALGRILAQRVWQGLAGIVTILIITNVLTLEQQGRYYSFLSFAALYTLFDLGLSLALVQAAAHSSSSLVRSPDGYSEAAGRLAALIAFGARYYARLAIAFVLLVLPAGWIFFSVFAPQFPAWQPAWITLAVAVALSLLVIPILAVYEGSGEIAAVAGVRLSQAVIGSVATWAILLAGGGLWATVMAPLGVLTGAMIWIRRRHSEVYSIIKANSQSIDWKTELWPLQWRIGLSWFSGYVLTQIHTLVLFSTQGASAAGQIGLSMTIGNMIGLFAQSFIARHVPAMAQAVARREWDEFDGLFRRDFAYSCALFIAASVVAISLAEMLTNTRYGTRILPIIPFGGLLLALFLGHVHGALAAQLRSYRREPLVWVAAAAAVTTLALVVPAAHLAGAEGIVAVMLAVQIILVLPLSLLFYYRRNREWRAA